MNFRILNILLSRKQSHLHYNSLEPLVYELTKEDWRLLSNEEKLIPYRSLKKDKEVSLRMDERIRRLSSRHGLDGLDEFDDE